MTFVWTLIVWVFGEGFGQILTGQALLLTGAPGGVLLYGIIGAAVWKKDRNTPHEWRESCIKFARYALGVLQILGYALQFQQSYLTSDGFSQAFSAPWLANVIGTNGLVVSSVVAAVEGLIVKYRIRATTGASIGLSAIFWWTGQSFGQVFQPLATDFNSGLLMIVLSLCAYLKLRIFPKHQHMQLKTQ